MIASPLMCLMQSCVRTIVIYIFRIKTILFIDHSRDFADGFYLVF